MKILVLTGNADRHFYLINRIADTFAFEHDIYAVINAKKQFGKSKITSKILRKIAKYKKYPQKIIKELRQVLINAILYPFLRIVKNDFNFINDHYFKGEHKQFFLNKNSIVEVKDANKDFVGLNSIQACKYIKSLNPDITIVMGTCLISKNVIESCGKVINIHTGLSPYYKGGNSNFWPIYHRYNNLCGYTVHEMTTGIDSGPILASAIVKAKEYNYSYPHINSVSIIKAVNKTCQIISNLEIYRPVSQWQRGRCFNNSDFDAYCCLKYLVIQLLLRYLTSFKLVDYNKVRTVETNL